MSYSGRTGNGHPSKRGFYWVKLKGMPRPDLVFIDNHGWCWSVQPPQGKIDNLPPDSPTWTEVRWEEVADPDHQFFGAQ